MDSGGRGSAYIGKQGVPVLAGPLEGLHPGGLRVGLLALDFARDRLVVVERAQLEQAGQKLLACAVAK